MATSPEQEQKAVIVVIAGRPYPLRVSAREEANVRAMADKINDRFNDFQVKFSDRDKQDCLVMTLLTYADELRQASAEAGGGNQITNRLTELNALVEEML